MKSNLKMVMKEMGLSKHQVATFSDVGMQTVEKIQAGADNLKLEGLIKVALALGVSVVEIYPTLATRPRAPRLMKKTSAATSAFLQKMGP